MEDPTGQVTEAEQTAQSLEPKSSEGPASMIGIGPPSPLTGCYLLIVIGEPHSAEHKDTILQRLLKGKLVSAISKNNYFIKNNTYKPFLCLLDVRTQ